MRSFFFYFIYSLTKKIVFKQTNKKKKPKVMMKIPKDGKELTLGSLFKRIQDHLKQDKTIFVISIDEVQETFQEGENFMKVHSFFLFVLFSFLLLYFGKKDREIER